MVTITFPDRETEKKAIVILLNGFSGRILKGGQHVVPEQALETLALNGIKFTVQGTSTYEQLTTVRDIDPVAVQ